MKNIYLLFFLLFLLSCSNDRNITGHWHILPEDKKRKYITMDIVNDTLAFLGKNSIYGSLEGVHNLNDRTLFFPGDCGAFMFKYKFDGTQLVLKNYLENWTAIKCDTLCSGVNDFKND